jgi:hypothetical protein
MGIFHESVTDSFVMNDLAKAWEEPGFKAQILDGLAPGLKILITAAPGLSEAELKPTMLGIVSEVINYLLIK